MRRRILTIVASMLLCLGLMATRALAVGVAQTGDSALVAQDDSQSIKATIDKVVIGKPITGTDGKQYLPVEVYFSSDADLGDSSRFMLEAYLRAKLANGLEAEGVEGLGMTLQRVMEALNGSNQFNWDWDSAASKGEGVLKLNVPLLGDGDTQTVEQSPYTGMVEANGVKEGDQTEVLIETYDMNGSGDPGRDSLEFVVEDESKYPKEITKEPKNVALAKMETSDGKVTSSIVLSWPQQQASLGFRPRELEGYTVSPPSISSPMTGRSLPLSTRPTRPRPQRPGSR